jgi:hypothetical protein
MPFFIHAQWSLSSASHAQQLIQDQQYSTHRNCAIGHIEGWKVPRTVIEIQEINDMAVEQAVNHIANCTT